MSVGIENSIRPTFGRSNEMATKVAQRRVLLVHNWQSVKGGAEVFVRNVARLLSEAGAHVATFSALFPAEESDARYADRFPVVPDYRDGGFAAKALRVPSTIYSLDARNRFRKVLEEFRPDIVHAFAVYGRLTPSVLDAAREAGVPVVMSCNDYKHICPNYKLYHHGRVCEDCKGGRFYKAFLNRCAHDSAAISAVASLEAYVHDALNLWRKNVSRFLFASRFMAQKTEEFWGKGTVAIDYFPNPFDANAHHVPENVGDYILYFGRLIEEKGVDRLIDAAERAPDVPVVIVGDGPDRAMLADRAARLSNVRMVGPAWGEDLLAWLHGARAVVVPSLWHENFPYVILQAFAAHKPVIGTRRGGIPELVDAGPHGWLYEPDDVNRLAEQMREVAAMADARLLEMGRAARRYVAETFSDAATLSRLGRIYTEVLT